MEKPGTPADTPRPHAASLLGRFPKCRNGHLRMSVGGSRLKEQTLGRWVHDFRARAAAGDGALSETERTELLRLRRENSDLKLDRAFLKKASLFFAQEASDTNGKRSS